MDTTITTDQIRAVILSLPEMAAWPEVAELFASDEARVRADWQLPILACRALGGDETAVLPAVAAVACLQISIILTDDMLDQDPRGVYHRLGYGRTANLASAFQAAALALVGQASAPAEGRAAASAALARAALTTAYGQELDVGNLRGEANYWRVVQTKSTPFYGVGLQLSALLTGSEPSVAQSLYDLGVLIGEIIQVYDDLMDAFQTPANPDWREGRNNLALLYASTAPHPRRARFLALLSDTDAPASLDEAQRILISSGAVSYCVYQLVERHRTARRLLGRLPLARPNVLQDILAQQMAPLLRWLRTLGIPIPPELLEETP